ncbi:hypothetical protein ABNQ38_33955 (plasmid) [Azospirillum sp. A29]|uniref:hypothetical protein n=1 Tax=Azospirillum sp. A29 TaxID=3160606 RepID=UPI00367059D3
MLLAEIDRRLGICERLARCIEDPRTPKRIRHTLAEMIRARALVTYPLVLRRPPGSEDIATFIRQTTLSSNKCRDVLDQASTPAIRPHHPNDRR